MTENILKSIEIGTLVIAEKDYIEIMLIEHNFQYDRSLSKVKLVEKYKNTILNKFGKPEKYPCIVLNEFDELNNIKTSFLYKTEVQTCLKEYKETIKKLEGIIKKMTPVKKTDTKFKY